MIGLCEALNIRKRNIGNMIDFGIWIDKYKNKDMLDEDNYGLFTGSFRCFKNDVVRPAYLLA